MKKQENMKEYFVKVKILGEVKSVVIKIEENESITNAIREEFQIINPFL